MKLADRQSKRIAITVAVILLFSILFQILIHFIIDHTANFIDYQGIATAIRDANQNIRQNYDIIIAHGERNFATEYAISAYFWKMNLIFSIFYVLLNLLVHLKNGDVTVTPRPFVVISTLILVLACTYPIYFDVNVFSDIGRRSVPPNIFGLTMYSLLSSMPSILLIRLFLLIQKSKP